jgi:DNA-binding winged helix-turn-helix (wHTH) protein/TolB-like protein
MVTLKSLRIAPLLASGSAFRAVAVAGFEQEVESLDGREARDLRGPPDLHIGRRPVAGSRERFDLRDLQIGRRSLRLSLPLIPRVGRQGPDRQPHHQSDRDNGAAGMPGSREAGCVARKTDFAVRVVSHGLSCLTSGLIINAALGLSTYPLRGPTPLALHAADTTRKARFKSLARYKNRLNATLKSFMSEQTKLFYDFGPYRLDATERRLWRDGRVVQLAPKALEALLVLVESGRRVPERGEIMRRIWPDSDADETNLAVMISSLRKALGERPDGGAYIETVPKQGYRFAVSVAESRAELGGARREGGGVIIPPGESELSTSSGEPAQGSSENPESFSDAGSLDATQGAAPAARERGGLLSRVAARRKVAALALAAVAVAAISGYAFYIRQAATTGVAASPRRLAVLPFRNLKPDDKTDFLGFSLADATITKLIYLHSIVVRPSSYIEKYRGQEVDPEGVAGELNVDTLMTGTFLKEGDNLRINVQLIDVEKGELLSRFSLNTKYEKLLTVQDEVAQNIVARLHLELTATEAERLDQRATENSLAYEYFLRGTDLYSRNEFLDAAPMLERAVELDPSFALAWAHLGRTYNACASFNLRGRAHHLKAQAAYEQALALNPDQIEATTFLANMLTDTNRVELAVPLLRRLLEANPNIAEARWELGYAYRFAGMLSESVEQCERARALDPNVKINSSAFNSYLYTGQYEKFMRSLPPGDASAFIIFYRGLGNYYMKSFEQATVDFDRAYEMDPQMYNRAGKALSFAIKNEKSVALDILRDVEREIEQSGVGDAEGIYKIAQAYAALKEREAALRVLRRSIGQGFFCYEYFKNDPLLENIRNEPAFDELMEIARARHEQFRRAFFQ